MDSLILDLGNSANWEQVWSQDKEAMVNPRGYRSNYYPMEEMIIPLFLDSPILAIYVTSSTAKPTWKSAGYLYQRLRIGVTVGGSADADLGESRHVALDRIAVAFWSRVVNNYELTFRPRRWMTQISLVLWKYTGPVSDSLSEQLDLLRIDQLRTEYKVDLLLEQQREL